MKVISEISVVSTLQDYQRFYRADPYSVHPRKVRSIEKVKEIAEENSYDVVPLLKLLEIPPSSGRGGLSLSSDGEVKIVKPANLTDLFFVDITNCERTTIDVYNSSEKGRLQDRDILILSAAHAEGYIGTNTSIVYLNDNEKAICIGELIRLRPNIEKINPYYLVLYLNSMFGKYMLNYSVRGQTVHLYPKDIEHLPVLLPPREIQDSIGNKLKQAIEAKIEAEKKRKEIEEILGNEFDLDWAKLFHKKKEMGYRYSRSLATVNLRVDPCFYHPFYEELLSQIKKNKRLHLRRLEELVATKIVNGTTPKRELKAFTKNETDLPFVRNGDIKNGLFLYDLKVGIKVKNDLFEKFKNISIKSGDVLISMTGTLGDACVVPSDIEKGIINQNVVRIRFNDEHFSHYFVEYLLYVGKYFMFQMSTGQIQEYLNTMILGKIPVAYPKNKKVIMQICEKRKLYLNNLQISQQFHTQAMEELNQLLALNSGGDKSWSS